MRGVFDEEEKEPAPQAHDTELTLGSGALLAIGLGLVALCAFCFVMGYSVGHRNNGPSPAAAPQPATDQEPLQASGSIPKPSAVAQAPVAPPPDSTDAANQPGAAADAAAASAAGAAPSAPANGVAAQPDVRQALPATASPQNAAGSAAQAVHPALTQPEAQQYMVQIAAVSNPEDADVLVNALKKRNYPVMARREPADNFVHVRIGPFATRPIAEQWRMKLLNDGYNAMIQP